MKEIAIRSLFSGWHPADRTKALEWARYKFRAITTSLTAQERTDYVNNRLSGIQFSLEDLS